MESLAWEMDPRALTSGQGYFTQKFSRFEEVPPHLAKRIVKEHSIEAKE